MSIYEQFFLNKCVEKIRTEMDKQKFTNGSNNSADNGVTYKGRVPFFTEGFFSNSGLCRDEIEYISKYSLDSIGKVSDEINYRVKYMNTFYPHRCESNTRKVTHGLLQKTYAIEWSKTYYYN